MKEPSNRTQDTGLATLAVRLLMVMALMLSSACVMGQQKKAMTQQKKAMTQHREALVVAPDTVVALNDALMPDTMLEAGVLTGDTLKRHKRDWTTWRPSPKRALWLALILPGAGQIYNRKYWKLPIFYGGFVGCAYAMRWNNQMYHDYSQAYLDIMDDDPNTQSYNTFLHLGQKIDDSNSARYKELFRKRKDRYRRWRDLSFFVMVGVYALSVVDAYVDASLSEFDISNNLSMSVKPTVIERDRDLAGTDRRNPFRSSAVGLQCSLNF